MGNPIATELKEQGETEAKITEWAADAVAAYLETQHPEAARLLATLDPELATAVVCTLIQRVLGGRSNAGWA